MTESETEAETIDRLEAALRKIAVAAHAPKKPVPAPAAPAPDHEALKDALDVLIARLRAGLTPPSSLAVTHAITE